MRGSLTDTDCSYDYRDSAVNQIFSFHVHDNKKGYFFILRIIAAIPAKTTNAYGTVSGDNGEYVAFFAIDTVVAGISCVISPLGAVVTTGVCTWTGVAVV